MTRTSKLLSSLVGLSIAAGLIWKLWPKIRALFPGLSGARTHVIPRTLRVPGKTAKAGFFKNMTTKLLAARKKKGKKVKVKVIKKAAPIGVRRIVPRAVVIDPALKTPATGFTPAAVADIAATAVKALANPNIAMTMNEYVDAYDDGRLEFEMDGITLSFGTDDFNLVPASLVSGAMGILTTPFKALAGLFKKKKKRRTARVNQPTVTTTPSTTTSTQTSTPAQQQTQSTPTAQLPASTTPSVQSSGSNIGQGVTANTTPTPTTTVGQSVSAQALQDLF